MIIFLWFLIPIGFLVLYLFDSERRKRMSHDQGGRIEYPLGYRAISIMGFFLEAFLAYVGLTDQDKSFENSGMLWGIILFVGAYLVIPSSAYWLFFESFFFKVVYDTNGITRYSPWARSIYVGWPEIELLTYASNGIQGQRINVMALDGRRFSIRGEVMGIRSFLVYAQQHLTQRALDNSNSSMELARESFRA